MQVLFKFSRYAAREEQPSPVVVHLNYHGDKTLRMQAVVDFYFNNDKHALDPYHIGTR